MPLFKIRNADGKFSSGGEGPTWGPNGKIWNGKGPLSSHLNVVATGRCSRAYDTAEIVEIELVVVSVESAREAIVNKRKSIESKKAASKLAYQSERVAAELKELARLQAKHGVFQ